MVVMTSFGGGCCKKYKKLSEVDGCFMMVMIDFSRPVRYGGVAFGAKRR